MKTYWPILSRNRSMSASTWSGVKATPIHDDVELMSIERLCYRRRVAYVAMQDPQSTRSLREEPLATLDKPSMAVTSSAVSRIRAPAALVTMRSRRADFGITT